MNNDIYATCFKKTKTKKKTYKHISFMNTSFIETVTMASYIRAKRLVQIRCDVNVSERNVACRDLI